MGSFKVSSFESGDYSRTVQYKILMCGNVEGNNNKYYVAEIQHDSKSGLYRIFTHYGRLGKTNMYDIRNIGSDLASAEKVFNSIISKKLKGKSKKNKDGSIYKENYEEVQMESPSVGSNNIRGKKTVETTRVTVSSYQDTRVDKLLKQLAEENIHNITSLTTFTATSSGFETPLGLVTSNHINKARQPLKEIKGMLNGDNLNPKDPAVIKHNNLYYSLIPHPFSSKIKEEDMILDYTALVREFDLLDQLETAVKLGTNYQSGQMSTDGTKVKYLEDINEVKRVKKLVRESKAYNHKSIWGYDPKAIYTVKIVGEDTRFETAKKKYTGTMEVFHGSRNCNLLSILTNGLMIPLVSAPGVTGRMFGDGIYGAPSSTKSLNYSIGFWSGVKNKYNNAFLFVLEFAMGKTFETKAPSHKAPKGYNSTFARKGSSLYNDEVIVYNTVQCKVKYLIEMRNK